MTGSLVLDPSDESTPVEVILVPYDAASEAAAVRATDLPGNFATDIETGGAVSTSPA